MGFVHNSIWYTYAHIIYKKQCIEALTGLSKLNHTRTEPIWQTNTAIIAGLHECIIIDTYGFIDSNGHIISVHICDSPIKLPGAIVTLT